MTKTKYRIIYEKEFYSYSAFLQFEKNGLWYYVPKDSWQNGKRLNKGLLPRRYGFFSKYSRNDLLFDEFNLFKSFELEEFPKTYPHIETYIHKLIKKFDKYNDDSEEIENIKNNPIRYL